MRRSVIKTEFVCFYPFCWSRLCLWSLSSLLRLPQCKSLNAHALSFIPPATGVQYVIHRYKQVLSAFVKKKSMSEAFRHLGIDRNTIANTASIAELHLAGKDMVPLVGMFRQGEETLVNYAQRCTMVIDSDTDLSRKIDQMKANGELLPISGKRPRGLHSHLQQLGGAAESILIGWCLFSCMEKGGNIMPSRNDLLLFVSPPPQSELLDLNVLCSIFAFLKVDLCLKDNNYFPHIRV